ncbi:hypothetical protein EW145_g4862 [Phellinidium pouzarii]|uniref:Prefoldin subunit 4 n=1 Tax=Phellinidium pouzarii TaxID=167371 RepID=A0A4S4L3W2_9AGAM|nr:hypothetical protein EW145_g4862 [Phellinidium pouzarii]
MHMLKQEEEPGDVEVNWDDQQRICTFSKFNTRQRSFQEKLEGLKVCTAQEKEALDDLSMELELADEDELVFYRVGETFIHMPLSRALKRLEHDAAAIDTEIAKLSDGVDECESGMKELKLVLYAKFGSAINLDE